MPPGPGWLGRAGHWARRALFNPCPWVSYALSPHYSPGHRVVGQERQAVGPSRGGCRNGQWPCTSRGSDSITEHMWAGSRRQPGVGAAGALGHLPGFAIQQPLSGEHLGFAERPMASGILFVPVPVPPPQEKGQTWTGALSPCVKTTHQGCRLRPDPEQQKKFYFMQKPRTLH